MRTEYNEGDLLTKEDIGLVFKTRDSIEYKLTALIKEKREGDHVAVLVDKNMTDIIILTKKGKDHDKPNLYKSDLVSFVGSEFTEDKLIINGKECIPMEYEGQMMFIKAYMQKSYGDPLESGQFTLFHKKPDDGKKYQLCRIKIEEINDE